MTGSTAHAPLPSSDSTRKICDNPDCSEFSSRKGWRISSGELADLCDRCASAYEEGRFCETFHPNAPGWRCCLTCGKRFHCGCVASCNSFQLLDFGGIMCSECDKHRFIGAPGTTWFPLFVCDERFKDRPVKKWINAGLVPLQEAPFFSNSILHPYMQSRTPHESGRLIAGGNYSGASEGQQTGNPKSAALVGNENENAGASKVDKPGSSRDIMLLPSSGEMPFVSLNEANGQIVASETPLQQSSSTLVLKEVQGNLHNGVDSTVGTRKRNNRPRVGAYGKGKLHPRYWPRFTAEELRLIAGNSNARVTPLFEKMLSATDAGKTGRLVLPKNYAEAYFPPLENQGRLSLTIQDTEGKDWIFRYRFWPNNKSRMYVLEGVASYMKHMQLKARDTVTFSRLEPGGKLVMGFRKANLLCDRDNDTRQDGNGVVLIGNASKNNDTRQAGNGVLLIGNANMDNDTRQAGNGVLLIGNASLDNDTRQAGNSVLLTGDPRKYNDTRQAGNGLLLIGEANMGSDTRQAGNGMLLIGDGSMAEMADPSLQSKVEGKSSIRKQKSSTLGSKSKRLRIENKDKIELMLNCEEANDLFRPPPNETPNVVEIEDVEFEEYKDGPVIAKPTVFAVDQSGFEVQWVQCDNCFKWRKVPADAHLSDEFICDDNTWDLERSFCSARQELTAKQVQKLIPPHFIATPKKSEEQKNSSDNVEAAEGLDTLSRAADLVAITGEKGEPSNLTTKHPRHGPGCSCIVCNQPPSERTLATRRRKNPTTKRRRKQEQKLTSSAGENTPAINGGGETTNSSSNQEPEKDNPAPSEVSAPAA